MTRQINHFEEITFDHLSQHFYQPLWRASEEFHMCVTGFKKLCRSLGIPRWPYRHLLRLDKLIAEQEVILRTKPSPEEQQLLDGYRKAKADLFEPQIPNTTPDPTTEPTDPPILFVEWHPNAQHIETPGDQLSDFKNADEESDSLTGDPLPTLEPNLSMVPSRYGLVQQWLLPSLRATVDLESN